MKYTLLIASLILILKLNSFAQTLYISGDTLYRKNVEQGLFYLKNNDFKSCQMAYQKAFKISKNSELSLLRAAFCSQKNGESYLSKSFIERAVNINYTTTENIWDDRKNQIDAKSLKFDEFENTYNSVVSKKESQLGINSALKKRLKTIHESDQKLRSQIDSIREKYGQNSKELNTLWKQIHKSDSTNLVNIQNIISKYGYPGKSLVGENEQNTVWLVIQHSALEIQEKYLPLIRKSAKKGEMDLSNLARLEDRILLLKGQKQIYGTQVKVDQSGKMYLYPVENKVNLNKLRLTMGLEPIEDYLKEFNIESENLDNKK